MKWYGDVEAPAKHWTGLTRWLTNEYAQAKGDVTKVMTGPGDWCPAPKVNDSTFVPEPRVDTSLSAGFSFVRDLRNMVEMATATGNTADATKFQAMLSDACPAFHKAWYDATAGHYGKGGQTAQVLALELDCFPDPATKAKVVAALVQNVAVEHGNHTTSGIIGWRWQPDVLSANGFGDVAYALMTQSTYPSIGYEIKGGLGEPATTLWELWDGDHEGPSMNSRNHVSDASACKSLFTEPH
jgi:alpha-L-rhamnosidase